MVIIEFNYLSGPANWSVIYPNCGGSKQSPVDIGSLLNKYDSSLGTLNIDSYHASTSSISDLSVSLVNTGHSGTRASYYSYYNLIKDLQ